MKYQVRYTLGEETIYTCVNFKTFDAAREFAHLNDSYGRLSWYEISEIGENGKSKVLESR